MKKEGKKSTMFPPSKNTESPAEDKGENEATETKIKKTGSFKGEPNKLGGGGRFKQMVASGKSPALAAFIGRKVYGKKKMASMAAKGKKG